MGRQNWFAARLVRAPQSRDVCIRVGDRRSRRRLEPGRPVPQKRSGSPQRDPDPAPRPRPASRAWPLLGGATRGPGGGRLPVAALVPATLTPMPDDAVVAAVDAIVRAGVLLPGVNGDAATAARFAGHWTERTKSAAQPIVGQRIYEVRNVRPPDGVPGASGRHAPPTVTWSSSGHAGSTLPSPSCRDLPLRTATAASSTPTSGTRPRTRSTARSATAPSPRVSATASYEHQPGGH